MPVNPKLKAIIDADTTMTQAYKDKLLSTFEDAPADFQNNWIANQDYQRNMNQLRLDREAMQKKNDEFYAKSETNIEAWKAEIAKANAAATAAQARIAELEGARGSTGLEGNDAITKEITRLTGLVTQLQTGIDEKIKDIVKAPDLEKTGAAWAGYIGDQVLTLNELSFQHQETFGKRLNKADNEALITRANELAVKLKRTVTLEDAYKDIYGADMQKKHDEQVGAKAVEEYRSKHEVPGAGAAGPGQSASERGPLQIRIEQERLLRDGKGNGEVPADWREAAAQAANELVREGKY